MGNTNRNLTAARKARRDEFYTQRHVIEDELQWYERDFRGRTVICNCNDWPRDGYPRSEFVRFFMRKMASWRIPRLIAVGYRETVGTLFENGRGTLYELANDGRPADRPYMEDDFTVTELDDSGGFETPECRRLLDIPNAIVCTNPPFGLFRDFMKVLDAHNVGFLVLGNLNAVTCKEIFPMFMDGRCWLGVSIHSGDRPFYVPDDYPLNAAGCGVDEQGHPYIRVKSVRWFTNLPSGRIGKNELSLEGNSYQRHPEKYPKYDDYDAINVNRVADIPEDYYGEIGVPITFLDKWAPDPDKSLERERVPFGRQNRHGNQPIRLRAPHRQRNSQIQADPHPAFTLIGELRHGKDGPFDRAIPLVGGLMKYTRLLIQRSDFSDLTSPFPATRIPADDSQSTGKQSTHVSSSSANSRLT